MPGPTIPSVTSITGKDCLPLLSVPMNGSNTHISKVDEKKHFNEGLANLIQGRSFYYVKGQSPANLDSTVAQKAIQTVYNDVMSFSKDKSIILASLKAEVLRDSRHIAALKKLATSKERAEYLGQQVQYALVSKVLNKGKSTKKSEELDSVNANISGSGANNPKARPGASQMITQLATAFDGNAKLYNIGTEYGEGEEGHRNVSIFSTPSLPGYVDNNSLKLVRDEDATADERHQNTLTGNDTLTSITKMSVENVYTENGVSVVNVVGNKANAEDLISNKMVIDPSADADMIFLPVSKDGTLLMDQYNRLKDFKVRVKQAFIDSTRKHQGVEIPSTADDLMKGNIVNQNDLKKYNIWLERGMEYDKLKQESEDDPTNKLKKKLYKLSADANKAILGMRKAAEAIFPKYEEVSFKPFLQVSVVFDDEKYGMVDKYDEKVKKGDYAFGTMVGLESGATRDFLQDTNDIDDNNWLTDNIFRTKVFIPMKSPAIVQSQQAGAKQDQVSITQDVYNQILRGLAQDSIASNPDQNNAFRLLKN